VTTTALLVLISIAAPPAPPAVAKAETDSALEAKFRQTEGWIGADGAFSVPLSETRTAWLFSDTWVGKIEDGKRKPVGLVNNTVGIQEGAGAGADMKVTFAIGQDGKGKHRAIFVPPDGKGWFWLFGGLHVDGQLHVFLPRLEKSGSGGAFGFKGLDLWLGTVSNPLDDPTKWKIAYQKVPFARFDKTPRRSFGSAVLRVDKFVLIYGYEEKPTKPFPTRKLLIARAPADKLADFDSWRFFSNGEWKADVEAATAQIDGLGTEFSVSYFPGLRKYALVTTENGLSDKITGRFATSPEGPWSAPVVLYTCPEMKKDRKVFTYAGKAHPHLSTGNDIVITYAVNSYELAPVINNAELYWPRFVRVTLK
jgi:Domain of unknown function (DUF4185)